VFINTWVELKDFDFSAGNDIQQLNPRDPSLVAEASKSFEALTMPGQVPNTTCRFITSFLRAEKDEKIMAGVLAFTALLKGSYDAEAQSKTMAAADQVNPNEKLKGDIIELLGRIKGQDGCTSPVAKG
jgi:hypothetical protein